MPKMNKNCTLAETAKVKTIKYDGDHVRLVIIWDKMMISHDLLFPLQKIKHGVAMGETKSQEKD